VIPLERQVQLVSLIRREPGLTVAEMAQRLSVSPGTIRNDLRTLADAGQVVRVRGGGTIAPALPAFRSLDFSTRAFQHEPAKQVIGKKAAELVKNGDSILLDASSSAYHLAFYLQNHQGLRVVTNGLEAARLLSQNPSHMVMLVGGTLRAGTQSVTGPWSLRFLEDIRARFAFVSCSGFTPESGMTDVDVYEAEFRVKAIGAAGQVIALIDSSKYGKVDLVPSLRLDQIHTLYTDSGLAPEWVRQLERKNLKFMLCE
jgi:DeoR/GlpR family transcriptional regulator of sugar metabolism